MRVIGISPLDKDATASVVEDGRILYAAGEERFSRKKQHAGFPYESLAKGLEVTGTRPEDVEEVCYAFLTWDKEIELIEKNLREDQELMHTLNGAEMRRLLDEARKVHPSRPDAVHGLPDPEHVFAKGGIKRFAYKLLALNNTLSSRASRYLLDKWAAASRDNHRQWQRELEAGLNKFGLLPKLKRYEHHLSHAANAYLNSGFERALIVTIDGYGTGLAGSISLGEGGNIKRLSNIPYPNSLGDFYESVTASLGYNPARHAGKIVGLAAYGDPGRLTPALLSTFERTPGTFRMRQAHNFFFSRHLACELPDDRRRGGLPDRPRAGSCRSG